MRARRIFPYLILNIIVSAATILTILWLWDRSRNINLPVLTPLPVASTPTPEDTPTLPPLSQPVILIKNVFGTGDLQNEVILLNRQGEGELELTGWQLKRRQRAHVYFSKAGLEPGWRRSGFYPRRSRFGYRAALGTGSTDLEKRDDGFTAGPAWQPACKLPHTLG